MADAQRSGRCGSNPVEVQVLSSAPDFNASKVPARPSTKDTVVELEYYVSGPACVPKIALGMAVSCVTGYQIESTPPTFGWI